MEIKKSIRIFWVSFFITFVLTVFVISLFWVHLKAVDKGFSGFDIKISLEKRDKLHYLITAGEMHKEIDLTTVDRAAMLLQKNERWMFPIEARTAYRIVWFTAEQIKDNSRTAREQEFFRNAGLV